MSTTAAILYKKDGYDTSGKRLMGRQAAGEGFLKSLVQYGTADSLFCCAATRDEFAEFCKQIHRWMQHPRKVQWLPEADPRSLSQAGTLYRPDGILADLAWQRRFLDPQAYSLCGVTHTIASRGVMQAIGDLLIAPVQPWDALICTSQAVKTAVDHLLQDWADYLAQRLGSRPEPLLQLPVIPLGVDCDSFAPPVRAADLRHQLRQRLGIGAEDMVILFVGRLIFYAKAHPVPMYQAVEQAAQTTQAKIHLIQAGWFENPREEAAFKEAAQQFAPSVKHLFLDGRQPEIRTGIWSAADIFVSLSDNIQETFGLTPIEAMASGLPVVITDWNGYQESVRQGIDGFKIPTLTPPADAGLDLAAGYFSDALNYSTFVGHACLATAVNVEACTQVLINLMTQPTLRQRLGENGRQRARATYDWRVVVAAYEQLWQQLAEIRQSATMAAPLSPGQPPHPLCPDPFRLFRHYPTLALTPDLRLSLGQMASPESLALVRQSWMSGFGATERLPHTVLDALLATLTVTGSLSVAEILAQYSDQDASKLARSLVYLLKFQVLRSDDPSWQLF
ncbi:glycosyl transferase [Neosynechococcus sphagnicola sy1]|uniref:Glycosyl transferase n=1 Tax=Neosynechococcus sphagnicola sy1 TaxID=1497020 RepID=A0A098TM96_9CYAN|nr:glycosyltransferase family 4 protein [Neosynechococcus sphagnicola]KGF71963.1 glycosyl transferase [Neosynechococcus sphagnicola sy1]